MHFDRGKTLLLTMNRQESIIWAAGFVDGEGNINIQRYSSTRGRPHRPCHNLLLQVSQTLPGPLQKLKELWGGRVAKGKGRQNPHWAPTWSWWVSGREAAQAIAELRPYLLVKREQADIALEFAQLKRQRASPSRLELNQREGLHLRLRALTKTGPKEPRQTQLEERPAQTQLRLIS